MTISSVLRYGEAQLASSSTPRLDAQVLLELATGLSKTQLMSQMHSPLKVKEEKAYEQLLNRRLQHEPIAYITRSKQFYSYDFYVDNRVLIPRPESESLIELTLAELLHRDGRILEIGTGSGCIAVTLKKKCPDAKICASDSSHDALEIARKNAGIHQAEIDFRYGNLFDPWSERFDIIVANLPYLPDDMPTQPDLEYEPSSALLGGKDGLELYREFMPQAVKQLSSNGIIAIEHLPSQFTSIQALCLELNLHAESFDRFVTKITANPQAPQRVSSRG